MKRSMVTGSVFLLLACGAATLAAQPADSTQAPAPGAAPASPAATTQQPPPAPAATPPAQAAPKKSFKDRIYYGGSVSLSFGGATQIGIFPMLAYKVTPKLSAGAEIGYQYVNYDDIDKSAHNYGGSVFGRYRVVPQLYGHVEFQAINYEFYNLRGESSRETVPFVLVGGGYVKRLNPRTSAYVEVLVDVLQDDKSPYDDWEPLFTFGVGVGF